jgi:glycosyltransferase involved in cell wall biosynthesis
MLWIPSLHPRFVPDADVIVASSWRTAETMAFWPASKGRKHYLIQHLETWDGPSDRVLATWRLPYRKIVIAQWLAEFARELGESFHYVPNGLDAQSFGIDTRPEDRNPHSVAMLYHTYAWKGSQDGIAALELARQEIPDLTATLFGTSARPADMPAWIRYLQDPPQQRLRALYNESAIFVAPSWAEGWPLPPAEAMACGCSLACTDIGGHREYAHDGLTALLSAPKAPLELARNVVTLATNQELRLRLSAGGKALIDQFTWERAATRLQAALREGIDAADMSAS